MTYQETVKYLLENTTLNKNKVFDYSESAGKEYFQKLFEFYTENLLRNQKFGANPSYIVFYGKDEIYAEAKKSNNHFIISFDIGIINRLNKWYGLYFDFSNIPGLENFKILEDQLGHKISELLEQSISHYNFYHEFAHLIQYAAEDSFEREDYLIGDCQFFQDKHIEEYDADTFAGICLATHLFQLIDDWMKDNLDKKSLLDFTSIIIGSVMVYILSLPMCKETFYTEEGSHPHNSIRALNILGVITTHFNVILRNKGSNLLINEGEVYSKAGHIIKILSDHFGIKENFIRFQNDISDRTNGLSKYHDFLVSKVDKYKHSAVKQWNLNK